MNSANDVNVGYYEWLRSPDEYLKKEMILTDLDAGTTYQVRVVAKNGGGYEAAATWLEFQTPGVGQSLEHSVLCRYNSLLSEFVKICYTTAAFMDQNLPY